MKTLFISVILLFSATILNAQNFTFSKIECPDLPKDGQLGPVCLFSTGEALITGNKVDAYYNGSSVSLLENTCSGYLSAIEEDGKIIAYSFRDGKYLYKWDDSTKTWYNTTLFTPMYNNHGGIYPLSSTIALCYSYTNDDSLFLWRYDIKDTVFTLLKKIPAEDDNEFGVDNVFKRGNDALVVVSNKDKSIILSYDYNSTFTEIDVIPFNVYYGYLFDNNFLYLVAGENREKIIKWNYATLDEEVIYDNSDFFMEEPFVLSNNEIIFFESNNDNISMLTINTGNVEILRYGRYYSSYNPVLKKALFVGNTSIVEMTITDGIISFTDINPIKLYPNPATNQITLVTDQDQNINTIEIFNNLGQKVLTPNILNNSIDISNLTKGIYFMKLSFQNGEIVSKKFIKN